LCVVDRDRRSANFRIGDIRRFSPFHRANPAAAGGRRYHAAPIRNSKILKRRRLFVTPLHQPFPIDAGHTEGLPAAVARGVRRYGLSYAVCRVPQTETPFREPGWEGSVFFRFQASPYPDIVSFTANNPDV
jgi:hypothetical protein